MSLNAVRAVVSGKRNRYLRDGYDLDLTYITDRVIAMGLPSSGLEGAYRNHVDSVSSMLHANHGRNYLIFNLSERQYDYGVFRNQVLEFGFPDHHPPPLGLLWQICNCMHAWLSLDSRNVAVVHCKAGKGRTGVVIVAYLLYSGIFVRPNLTPIETAHEALAFFLSKRGEGVNYPSQIRYVEYLTRIVYGIAPPGFEALQYPCKPPSAPTSPADDGDGFVMVADVRYWEWLGGLSSGTRRIARQHDGGVPVPPRRRASAGPVALDAGAGLEYLQSMLKAVTAAVPIALPLPRRLILKAMVLSTPPLIQGGVRPIVHIMSGPRQGVPTRILYNTSWDTPEPALYTPDSGCIGFSLKDCDVAGDILVRVLHMPGEVEIFYFAFHTSFLLSHTEDGGVVRFDKAHLDISKRSKRHTILPDDFHLDLVISAAPSLGNTQPVGAGGGAAAGAATSAPTAPDRRRSSSVSTSSLSELATLQRESSSQLHKEAEASPPKPAMQSAIQRRRDLEDRSTKMGWLYKEGGFIKSWHRRWFVLRNFQMTYYASQSDTTPKGIIPLKECGGVTQLRPEAVNGRKLCFKLIHATRTYIFQAASQEEMEEWINCLALALAGVQEDVHLPNQEEGGLALRSSRESHSSVGSGSGSIPVSTPSPASSVPGTVPQSAKDRLYQQVWTFYQEHNPEKCTDAWVAEVVDKYQGKEDMLWRHLRAKYPTKVSGE